MKSYFILFILSVLMIFGLHFFLLEIFGFNINGYILAVIFVIPALALVSYIFISTILKEQESYVKSIEDLTKETLHEINLPIATIEANIKLIEKSLDEKSLKRTKRVMEATKRLKRLYSVLNYRVKKEIFEINIELVDIEKIIIERVEFFKRLNRNSFSIELDPFSLNIDKIGFEQVVDNIIENSMKYSSKDDSISIKLKDRKLTIEDRGIGISQNDIIKVYNRYFQSDERNIGEGIGLAVVKKFCDKYDIGLKISSPDNCGTKVELRF